MERDCQMILNAEEVFQISAVSRLQSCEPYLPSGKRKSGEAQSAELCSQSCVREEAMA